MTTPTLPSAVEELRRTLARELEDHRTLLRCLDRKREAVRVADVDGITRQCQDEAAIVRRLTECDQARPALIARAAASVAGEAGMPVTIAQIADALDVREPGAGEPLRAVVDALRDAAGRAKRDSTIVANAARALIGHVTGVMQVVNGALSRARLYERGGQIAVGSQTEFCVDVTS